MKKIGLLIMLILFMNGLTGCSSLLIFKGKGEQSTQPQGQPQAQTDSAPENSSGFSASLGSFTINIPEASKEETLNIPGTVGLDQLIFINETEVPIGSEGKFDYPMQLIPGQNRITIKVMSMDGKSIYTTEKTVRYTPTISPDLSVSIPSAFQSDTNMLILKGTTGPDCVIDANGYKANPDEKGDFLVGVPLRNGDNIVKVVSTNPSGKTSTVQQVVRFSKVAQ